MRISRRGTHTYHGQSSVELPSPTFEFVKSTSSLTIKQYKVKDFSTSSNHNYTIRVSLAEIGEMLKTLAEAAFADPRTFEKDLATSLKAIVQLQSVIAGVRA